MLTELLVCRDCPERIEFYTAKADRDLPIYVPPMVACPHPIWDDPAPIFPNEYRRAFSYFLELNTPFGPQQKATMMEETGSRMIC
uniref:Uncharacterized protein n=1 Tax=Leviviridae sp. TaxID=2027243 RepID=A0A514D8V1_9VIRU|nr:MAG: hypothetical protein H2Bulk34250_000001 [Leviviridae sp.]